MKVYLVQHGLAAVRTGDSERFLTDQGQADVRKITDFIRDQARFTVDTIYHSGKLRARQTAEILAEAIRPARQLRETTGLAPMDNPGIWAQRLSEMDDDCMLVGHMPHLPGLIGLLLTGDELKTPVSVCNGGVICLWRGR